MLSKNFQNELYNRFTNLDGRRNPLFENFNFRAGDEIDGKKSYSVVAYIDIASFSKKIINMSSLEVKNYLFEYYELIFPIIKKHRGRIDRIMGDGIIVVFSTVFNDFSLDKNAMFHCLCVLENV